MLRARLAAAASGEAFVLQGGDCAETFADATADNIRDRVKTILQMAAVLTYGASVPVVKIGRMAGQYAKPRSSDTETREGVTLPAYRGDMVNDFEFTEGARTPDPQRLVRAYHAAASTLNLVRAFTTAASPTCVTSTTGTGASSPTRPNSRYEKLAHDIDKAMKFMARLWRRLRRDADHASSSPRTRRCCWTTSEPLTRIDSRTGRLYDTSAHFVWVGERTRHCDGAHVDFVSRIHNPIGVKVSARRPAPTTSCGSSSGSTPTASPGGSTFITRMGAGKVRDALPAIVEKVTDSGAQVDVGLRPDARQHLRVRDPVTRRGSSTTSSTRCGASSRCTAAWAPCPAASTSS